MKLKQAIYLSAMDLQHLLTNKGLFHTDTCMHIYTCAYTYNESWLW